MKEIYDLLSEPTFEIYKTLLVFSLKTCDKFQFVVQHTIKQNKSVQEVINKFEKFQLSVEEKSEWPGTKLFKGSATIYTYALNKESITLLINTNNSLYSWVQPHFPEDLCFLRSDSTPWLATITYERDAYFELTVEEKEEIKNVIPEIVLNKHILKKVD